MGDHFLEFNLPPMGKVECFSSNEDSVFIKWAPGNSAVYTMLINRLSDVASEALDGRYLLTLRASDGSLSSYPISSCPLYHHSYIREKFECYMTEEATVYYSALLNWVLLSNDDSLKYAKELYDEAMNRWV